MHPRCAIPNCRRRLSIILSRESRDLARRFIQNCASYDWPSRCGYRLNSLYGAFAVSEEHDRHGTNQLCHLQVSENLLLPRDVIPLLSTHCVSTWDNCRCSFKMRNCVTAAAVSPRQLMGCLRLGERLAQTLTLFTAGLLYSRHCVRSCAETEQYCRQPVVNV